MIYQSLWAFVIKNIKNLLKSVDVYKSHVYNNKSRQRVERNKRTTNDRQNHYSEVAQLVEHPAVNRQVAGSSPAFGATARWSSG